MMATKKYLLTLQAVLMALACLAATSVAELCASACLAEAGNTLQVSRNGARKNTHLKGKKNR